MLLRPRDLSLRNYRQMQRIKKNNRKEERDGCARASLSCTNNKLDRKSVRHIQCATIGSLLVRFFLYFLFCFAHENETRQYHKLKSSVIARVEHFCCFIHFLPAFLHRSRSRLLSLRLSLSLSRANQSSSLYSQTDKSHFDETKNNNKNTNPICVKACRLQNYRLVSLHL